jgi:hypothetical protein
MTIKSRLFIDLDGTVARFYDASPNYLEEMYEKGYFRNLQPYEKMTEGIKLFMKQHKDVEVFTLSAKVNGEPPYCEAEKQEWLDEYLPEIDREHRLFTEIGHNKAEYIPNGISNTDVLYDDYNKNLIDWENSGGVALKCHNNINMKGLGAYGGDKVMWEGQVLKNDIEPQDIANSLYETVSAAQSMSSVNGKPLNEAVRTALKLINNFSVAEFGDTSAYDDVQDLSDVALAYTTDSDEELPIQVSADLENFRIVTEYDNVVAHIDSYNSLEEMNELCFENLNFDDLIYLSEKEKQSAIDKTIIYSTEYNGEIDYFKAADKRLSVLFEKLSKDNTYAELSKAEKISAFEFAEIEQSKNLIASVTFDLDNNNVGIYRLRRAVSEGNRTPNDFISEEHSIAEMKQLVSEAKLNSLNIEKDFRNLLDKRIAERSEKNVVDIIDQYNSSGKPFYEFFEENKDKVMATYTDSIGTPYYSRHINRHWLSENFYIENRVDSDTFGSETAKSESTVLVNVYDPSKGSISNKKIDGMSWEERLNLPVETKTIGKHLLEDLKPSESPFILSAYSDLFGEEHIKKAYLKSCVEEAENEIAELRSYEDISPYGGEDVTVGTFESHLYETLIDAREMGYDSIGEVALRCVELGLIDEKKRKDVIYGVYHSVASIKQGYAKGLLSKSDVKYLIDRNEPALYESKDIVDSLLKTKEMSKMRDKLLVAIKLYSAKSENYRNHGDLKESKILDDRVAACIKGYDYYSQQIIDTYNSVFSYVRPENGLVKLETEDIPVSINLNGKQTEFYEHRITTDKNIIQKAYWECMDKCPNMYVPEDYNPFTEEACDELYRLIGENPPQRYEGIQTIKLPFEIADKIDLTLKLVDTELYKIACIENQKDLLEGANLETAIDSMKEKYESSMKVISKIDEIKSKINANEADVESLKGIKPNFVNKVFRHSEIKKREIASANLKNNKAELEQAYSELDRISHSMEYVREKFADYYSENLSSCKPSIKIHFPDDEKSYEIYSLSDIEKISQTSKELNNVLKNGFNERVEDVNIAFYSIYDNKFDLLERERVSAYLADKMPLEYLNVDKMIQLENMVIDTKGLDYKYIKVPKECLLAFEGSCHRQDIDYAMSSGENTGNYCIARYRSLQEKAVIKTLKTVERAYSEHTAALAAAQQNNSMSSAATMM